MELMERFQRLKLEDFEFFFKNLEYFEIVSFRNQKLLKHHQMLFCLNADRFFFFLKR